MTMILSSSSSSSPPPPPPSHGDGDGGGHTTNVDDCTAATVSISSTSTSSTKIIDASTTRTSSIAPSFLLVSVSASANTTNAATTIVDDVDAVPPSPPVSAAVPLPDDRPSTSCTSSTSSSSSIAAAAGATSSSSSSSSNGNGNNRMNSNTNSNPFASTAAAAVASTATTTHLNNDNNTSSSSSSSSSSSRKKRTREQMGSFQNIAAAPTTTTTAAAAAVPTAPPLSLLAILQGKTTTASNAIAASKEATANYPPIAATSSASMSNGRLGVAAVVRQHQRERVVGDDGDNHNHCRGGIGSGAVPPLPLPLQQTKSALDATTSSSTIYYLNGTTNKSKPQQQQQRQQQRQPAESSSPCSKKTAQIASAATAPSNEGTNRTTTTTTTTITAATKGTGEERGTTMTMTNSHSRPTATNQHSPAVASAANVLRTANPQVFRTTTTTTTSGTTKKTGATTTRISAPSFATNNGNNLDKVTFATNSAPISPPCSIATTAREEEGMVTTDGKKRKGDNQNSMDNSIRTISAQITQDIPKEKYQPITGNQSAQIIEDLKEQKKKAPVTGSISAEMIENLKKQTKNQSTTGNQSGWITNNDQNKQKKKEGSVTGSMPAQKKKTEPGIGTVSAHIIENREKLTISKRGSAVSHTKSVASSSSLSNQSALFAIPKKNKSKSGSMVYLNGVFMKAKRTTSLETATFRDPIVTQIDPSMIHFIPRSKDPKSAKIFQHTTLVAPKTARNTPTKGVPNLTCNDATAYYCHKCNQQYPYKRSYATMRRHLIKYHGYTFDDDDDKVKTESSSATTNATASKKRTKRQVPEKKQGHSRIRVDADFLVDAEGNAPITNPGYRPKKKRKKNTKSMAAFAPTVAASGEFVKTNPRGLRLFVPLPNNRLSLLESKAMYKYISLVAPNKKSTQRDGTYIAADAVALYCHVCHAQHEYSGRARALQAHMKKCVRIQRLEQGANDDGVLQHGKTKGTWILDSSSSSENETDDEQNEKKGGNSIVKPKHVAIASSTKETTIISRPVDHWQLVDALVQNKHVNDQEFSLPTLPREDQSVDAFMKSLVNEANNLLNDYAQCNLDHGNVDWSEDSKHAPPACSVTKNHALALDSMEKFVNTDMAAQVNKSTSSVIERINVGGKDSMDVEQENPPTPMTRLVNVSDQEPGGVAKGDATSLAAPTLGGLNGSQGQALNSSMKVSTVSMELEEGDHAGDSLSVVNAPPLAATAILPKHQATQDEHQGTSSEGSKHHHHHHHHGSDEGHDDDTPTMLIDDDLSDLAVAATAGIMDEFAATVAAAITPTTNDNTSDMVTNEEDSSIELESFPMHSLDGVLLLKQQPPPIWQHSRYYNNMYNQVVVATRDCVVGLRGETLLVPMSKLYYVMDYDAGKQQMVLIPLTNKKKNDTSNNNINTSNSKGSNSITNNRNHNASGLASLPNDGRRIFRCDLLSDTRNWKIGRFCSGGGLGSDNNNNDDDDDDDTNNSNILDLGNDNDEGGGYMIVPWAVCHGVDSIENEEWVVPPFGGVASVISTKVQDYCVVSNTTTIVSG